MQKRVFLIAYAFPPVGGAAVQRSAKFAKFLNEFGWSLTVLTVANPSVPVFDESLLKDIPECVEVIKAKTLEPGYAAKNAVSDSAGSSNRLNFKGILKKIIRSCVNLLLQPDPQILWLPDAYRQAKEVLKKRQCDVILATAPPFSSFLLGVMLAKATGIPLILDYRDEWDISNSVWENKGAGRVSLYIQNKIQNFVLARASAVIATTPLSVGRLRSKTQLIHSEASLHCIYNGYDPTDFNSDQVVMPTKKAGRYMLSYTGTLWNLTSIEPLVRAIIKLSECHPELAALLELRITGRRTAKQDDLLRILEGNAVTLNLSDYLPHNEAVGLMKSSDGLCLLLSDYEFAGRVVPAKIFEYMAAKKTIFAITPQGEIWNLLKDYPSTYCIEPQNVNLLVDSLKNELSRFREGAITDYSEYDSSKFSRKTLAGHLSEVMNGCLSQNS